MLALGCFVAATALAFMDLVVGNGVFWKLVQMTLFGAGGLIFWREGKRVRAATTSVEVSDPSEEKPPPA